MKVFNVVIPVYNTEEYIKECIQSVLEQSYQSFRIVIVNDGSTDSSYSICKSFAESDDRVVLLSQNNQGQIAARQKAIDYILDNYEIDDSYIIHLDSDDRLKKEALAVLNNCFLNHNVDIAFYRMHRIVDGAIIVDYSWFDSPQKIVSNKRELYNIVFNNARYNSMCCKAINTRLFSHSNFEQYYHIRHGEDLIQSIEYYKQCDAAAFMGEYLYEYRANPKSVTLASYSSVYEVDSTVRKAVIDFVRMENVWSDDDYANYMKYCRDLLIEELRSISRLRRDRCYKVYLFEKILEDDYYSTVACSNNGKELILKYLINRDYDSLIRRASKRNYKKSISIRVRKLLSIFKMWVIK